MGGFRRLIIGLADFFAVCSIVAFTVLGGVIGYSLGAAGAGFDSRSAAPGGAMMLGAVIGFGIAAMAAALMFTLSEIASNTRKAVVLLQRSSIPSSSVEKLSLPGTAGQLANLSQEALIVLRKAQEQGYRVKLTPDKEGIVVSSTLQDFRLYSELDILNFSERLG